MKRVLIDGETSYDLSKQLGKGGFGYVYLASVNGEQLAVKILGEKEDELTEEMIQQWQREAEAAKSIIHPNVIKTVASGKGMINRKEKPYIAMELADGGNLIELIRNYQLKSTLVSEDQLIGMFKQMLSGLGAVHETVLHRDIKPQNILIKDDVLKLSDFGLSKYVEELTRSKTYKGWGTYFYMAPEVWSLSKTSKATDIYSLGIVFYQLTTLGLPYESEDVKEIEQLHKFGKIPRAKDINSSISHRLDGIIFKMMQKAQGSRYQSVEEVLEALAETSSTSSNESVLRAVTFAKSNIDAEARANAEAERIAEQERELKSICSTHVDAFISSLQTVLDEFNQHMPEKQAHISKGNDTTFDVLWGYRDLLRFEFHPAIQLESGKVADKDMMMAGTCLVQTGNRRAREGMNFFWLNTPDDIYGELAIVRVSHNPFIVSGSMTPFAIQMYELNNVLRSWNVMGKYQAEILKISLEDELRELLGRAFDHLNRDDSQPADLMHL